jgi:hypothetical protein
MVLPANAASQPLPPLKTKAAIRSRQKIFDYGFAKSNRLHELKEQKRSMPQRLGAVDIASD